MTNAAVPTLISALGAGRSIAEAATAAGVSPAEAERLFADHCRAKLPPSDETLTAGVSGAVEIVRDAYGVPHVYAEREPDLFFGLGYAMAQDRLWLMDYLRRKASGRLAELLGERYVNQDLLYRILDFPTVCSAEYGRLGQRWRALLDGMAGGVNLAIDRAGGNLPVEFELVGYQPERWTPVDILVTLRYQWWGLSGRLFQITSATQLDRALGEKVADFIKPERDDLYIVPDGLNAAESSPLPLGEGQGEGVTPVRDSLHLDASPHGSNNWVIAGSRTRSGKPLLANDPHYSYSEAHGNFYPCHLSGAGHSEAGFVFLGTPGMMTGRNDRIAWGFTNNGATIRDLYAEQVEGDRYRRGEAWEPLSSREVTIDVKGGQPLKKTIRSTAHGPIVNDVVPGLAAGDAPLALRWVGFEPIDDVQSLVEMNTATDWGSFREALRSWSVSVTNFIYGDVEGNVGYQLSARVPLREVSTRGIRPAWDPAHEWQGYIPFEGNPRIENPPDGIIATANQRPVNPSYRWPFYGAYAGGTRQARILQVLRAKSDHDAADFRRMQFDSKMLIAEEVVPRVVAALRRNDDPRLRDAAERLAAWDFVARADALAPAIYEMFMDHWTPVYAGALLPDDRSVQGATLNDDAPLRAAAGAAARRALVGEEPTDETKLDALIAGTMRAALDALAEKYGADPDGWSWGRMHWYSWPHPLGGVGDLGKLLNGPKLPCSGTSNTINNVAPSHARPFQADSGPTYRLIADLSDPSAVAVNSHAPMSANPASPHFAPTIRDWAQGNYQLLRRDRALVEIEATGRTRIGPG